MLKLNTKVKDSASGMAGVLTMLHMEMNGDVTYGFQPASLNPKTKVPVAYIWLVADRIVGGTEIEDPELPANVLGTPVQDIATGFKGTAVSLCLHSTGCVHFNVQCKGVNEDGNAIECQNFSILRLRGPALKELSESAANEVKKANPSPGNYSHPQKQC